MELAKESKGGNDRIEEIYIGGNVKNSNTLKGQMVRTQTRNILECLEAESRRNWRLVKWMICHICGAVEIIVFIVKLESMPVTVSIFRNTRSRMVRYVFKAWRTL